MGILSIESLITEMLEERGALMAESDIGIELSPTHVRISPPPILPACLGFLMDNLILRARQADRACAASIDFGLVEDGPHCLRLILSDDLPGLAPDEFELYAHLAGMTRPPANLSPPARSLAALAVTLDHLVQYFDLYSTGSGGTLWVDIALPEAPTMDCMVARKPLGWFRRQLHDGEDLVQRLQGDRRIADRVLTIFLSTTPDDIERLNRALVSGDGDEVRLQYHSIKGSAANVGGLMLSEVAWAGERAAVAGDLKSAQAILPRLRWEFERLARHCHRDS